MKRECDIVQDLLALYAEREVSAGTAGFVEDHLAACEECRQLLEDFKKPVFPAPGCPPPLPGKTSEKPAAAFLFRLRRTMLIALVLLFVTTTGLVSATYYAGKNVAMRDPAYARAEKMGSALSEDASNLKLSFPPLYVYRQAGVEEKLKLDLSAEGGVLLGRTITAAGKEIYLDRLTVKGNEVILSYSLPGQQGYFPLTCPNSAWQMKRGGFNRAARTGGRVKPARWKYPLTRRRVRLLI